MKKLKQTNAETANEMWKNAFVVKKTRFANENPQLSEDELNKITAAYFRKMSESKQKW